MRRQLSDNTPWDEFHDDEIVDWKRCRSAIEHENTLVNHRLSWLFASQSFLFASFGVVWNAWKNPSGSNSVPAQTSVVFLIIIAITGIVVCTAIQQSLLGAEKQIILLDRWWYLAGSLQSADLYTDNSDRAMQRVERDRCHPPIQGDIHIPGNFFSRVISFTFLPNWFNVVWGLLAFTVVIEKGPSFLVRSVTDHPLRIVLLIIYSTAIMFLFRMPSDRPPASLKADVNLILGSLCSIPRKAQRLLIDLILLVYNRGWNSCEKPYTPFFASHVDNLISWLSSYGGLFLKSLVGLLVAAALIELTPLRGLRLLVLVLYGILLARLTCSSKLAFSSTRSNKLSQADQESSRIVA
jgi:hypothetical protein